MPKVLTQVSGDLVEIATTTTTAGAGDANKIPELNAAGILAPALLNAKNTSAGAGDAGKIPQLNAAGILDPTIINAKNTSAGAGDAAKVPLLDAAGRLDSSFLPVGVGADTASIQTTEALAAGDLVNTYDVAGNVRCRKADGSTTGKEAHGFVLAAVGSGANATVYFEGSNTAKSGLTGGRVYLSATVAGGTQQTAPTGTGKTVQIVGYATSATVLNFNAGPAFQLA